MASDKINVSTTDGEEEIGTAGKLTKTFLHSPLTPLLLVGFLILGIMGLIVTPRQEDPQISVPMVDIFVQYPGANVDQVTHQVAVPLEQVLMEIKGVDHVYSASARDQAVVTVQFDVGENMEDSLVKLYDKLASNMDKMPLGATEPLVKPKGVDDVPIVTLTLWSEEENDATLRLIALDLLKHIKRIPDTSQGFIVSGRQEQMTVHIYPEKLAGHGITLDQISATIQAANTERNAGSTEVGGTVATVYSGSFLRSEHDLERLVVGLNEGRPVYLRDIADVTRGPNDAQSMVSYYTGAASESDIDAVGLPAVTLAIAKKKGSNGVSVADETLELVEHLKGRIIPDNVHVSVTRDYGETANEKVNELIFKLFVATGAVVLLVWFFLGWRAALVVAIVVPIVITFTVFMAFMMGFTIDRVSLFALIFSIGILVDDAIVVVENVYRRWLHKGEIDTPTTIAAVDEVGNPTILATFTVVAALLPMAAVRGMMGPYMAPIPILGSVAMVFSLFAAFVFTPWLAFKLKPSIASLHKAEEKEEREVEILGRFYRRMLLPMVENRRLGWLFLGSLFLVFFICMSLFYTKSVRVKMLPLDNKPEFNIVVNFPEGTALPETANLVGQLAEEIRQLHEVTAIQTYVGTSSPFNFNGLVRHYYLRRNPWEADLQIQLNDKHDRDRTSHEIAEATRTLIQPLVAAVNAKVQIVEMPPGPPVLQSVVAEVYGPDAQTRRDTAHDLEALFVEVEHLDDVDTLMPDEHKIWSFEVDREKAQGIGVSVDDVNRTLQMAMGGFQVGDIKYNSVLDVTRIIMESPLPVRGDFGRIGQLPVPTLAGGTIPLSELGQFKQKLQDPVVFHKDLRPVEFVTAETVGTLAAPIYGMMEVDDLLKDYVAPDGVTISGEMLGPPASGYSSAFEWAGEWTVTYETFRDMGIAFGIALVMIYMLVVWEFGNFVLPAIIMAPIPLTLVGIVPGHWLMNAEFTATSMIGFIALAGIIVRNSILLVDYARHRVMEGEPVLDALIESCQVRTRPIVITALALVGGSSVILFDPIFQGMAVALLFGVLVSTALTLFIIPLGCYSARHHLMHASDGDDPEGDPEGGDGNEGAPKSGGGAVSAIATGFGMVGLYAWELVKSIAVGVRDLSKSLTKWGGKRMNAASKKRADRVVATAKEKQASESTGNIPQVVLTPESSIDKPIAEVKPKSVSETQPKNKISTEEKELTANNKDASKKIETKKPSVSPLPKKATAKNAAAEKTAIEKAGNKMVATKKAPTEKAGAEEEEVAENNIADKVAALKAAAAMKPSKKKEAPKKAIKKAIPKKAVSKKKASLPKSEAVPVKKKIARVKSKGPRGIRLKGKP